MFKRYGILAANLAIIVAVAFFVWHSQTKADDISAPVARSESGAESIGPLDSIAAADIATNVAYAASLPQADNVRNQADSFNASLAIASTDDIIIAKPQIVAGGSQSRQDIIFYTTKDGDTVSKLATEFNVSSNSIKWSNSISTDFLPAGKELVIPPRNRNGIVYKVKAGDTLDSIATKYRSTKEKIESFNDTEIAGLPVGEYILIPDGEQVPEPTVNVNWGTSSILAVNPIYAGNGYSFGYCTFWAAKRRADIGRPIPSNWGNAYSWDEYARGMGYSVSKTPTPGSIVQDDGGQYYYIYHVAFVESVNPDGSVVVSEMNVKGWNVVSSQTIPAAVIQRGILDFID